MVKISENNEKQNIIDVVNYTQVNDEKNVECYTMTEVAEMLNVEEYKIAYWYNEFNYLLNIPTIGVYQVFDVTDVEFLKKIKKMNIDEKMSIKSIKEYFEQHNEEVIVRENRTLGNTGMGIIEVLGKVIEAQNTKVHNVLETNNEILAYNKILTKNQEKFIKILMQMSRDITNGKEEQARKIDKLEKSHQKELSKLSGQIKELTSTINKQQDEMKNFIDIKEKETQKRYIEMEDSLKKRMEERKEQNKGFFSRLFNKD